MNNISRRVFMKMVGMLSVLGWPPGILNSLESHATELEGRSWIHTGTPICFVGVGDFGEKISMALKTTLHYDTPNSQNQYNDQNKIVLLNSTDINFGLHPFTEPLIFLAGSILNKNFWIVRDFIISKNPELIITTALPELGFKRIITKESEVSNECWIALPNDNQLNIATNIICDIYHSINLPGSVNFNLADYLDLSNKIGFGISMECSAPKNVPEFKRFVQHHSKVLENCKKFLILLLSFDCSADFDLQHLTDLAGIVYEAVDSDIGVSWCAQNDLTMNSKFRATIIVC